MRSLNTSHKKSFAKGEEGMVSWGEGGRGKGRNVSHLIKSKRVNVTYHLGFEQSDGMLPAEPYSCKQKSVSRYIQVAVMVTFS